MPDPKWIKECANLMERRAAEALCETCFQHWLDGETEGIGCDLCPKPVLAGVEETGEQT